MGLNLERVSSLRALAPGDFAAVKRANAFYPIKDSDDFAKRLADEVKIKNTESSKKIGVLSDIMAKYILQEKK